MAVEYSPEWLSETAVANLLTGATAIENIFISDTLQKRVWPCLVIQCQTSEEIKIGRRPAAVGGYQSGVFLQTLEINLEMKADSLVQPSQNAQVTEEAAKLRMQVYQALHFDTLLQDRLTAAVNQPYECFSAYLGNGEQSVNDELRVWQKPLKLELRVMARASS